jgi:hypothetical protein
MRTLTWIILGLGTTFTMAEAPAQTYDPRYPVCLQVWDNRGSYIECGYTSMPQCAASASGRAAQCWVNPYFAHPYGGRRAYRHRQLY